MARQGSGVGRHTGICVGGTFREVLLLLLLLSLVDKVGWRPLLDGLAELPLLVHLATHTTAHGGGANCKRGEENALLIFL